MQTNTQPNLSQYRAITRLPPNLVQTPTFPTGEFGKAIFNRYKQERETTYRNNPNLKLQFQDDTITGVSFFDPFLLDEILSEVKGSPRTPTLADLADPKILEMIREKYYTSPRSLVLRGTTDPYNSRNQPLARFLAEQEGVDLSRLEREPALIHGLTLKLWEEDTIGYGLRLVPSDEFTVYHDDRFLEKYNDQWFTQTDGLGIPSDLNERKLSPTAKLWYTGKNSLSRLILYGGLDLSSDWYDLVDSDPGGRVVIVGGEATTQNFSRSTQEQ